MARQLIFSGTKRPQASQNSVKVSAQNRPLSKSASELELSAQSQAGREQPCATMNLQRGLLKSSRSAARSARTVAHLCMDAGVYAARQAPWARASCAVAQEAAIRGCARTAERERGSR